MLGVSAYILGVFRMLNVAPNMLGMSSYMLVMLQFFPHGSPVGFWCLICQWDSCVGPKHINPITSMIFEIPPCPCLPSYRIPNMSMISEKLL
jgi:hypothetical protein